MVDNTDRAVDRRFPRWHFWLSLGLLLILWVGYSAARYPIIAVYKYESSDGGFKDSEIPAKGRTLASIEQLFEDYRSKKEDPNLKLYRLDYPDWTNLFCYPDNLSNRRWKLPRKPART